jgi:hypothetical protein
VKFFGVKKKLIAVNILKILFLIFLTKDVNSNIENYCWKRIKKEQTSNSNLINIFKQFEK